jgi:hypothetical protein
VGLVDAVFGHCRFVWLLRMDVALVLLDPGLDGTACLPSVDLTAHKGMLYSPGVFESQVILHMPKEAGIFFRSRLTDLMLCLDDSKLM